MTERLYYSDPYLTEFDAVITKCIPDGEASLIYLDKSAFYPTSGGQPYDKGTIDSHEILDVYVDNGDVVHKISGSATEGDTVHCLIDKERRHDHMQQHCGEHMLANIIFTRYNGFIHGLHIGEDFSSIDVTMPDGRTKLTDEEINSIEDEINEWISRDEEVKCWFPDAEELASLPLRKPAGEYEHIRIVYIAPREYCACGGTHPRRTGEVGCMRILGTSPARGKMRVSFLCGKRAVIDNRLKSDAALKSAEELSCSWTELPEAVARLNERCAALTAEIRGLKREMLYSGLMNAPSVMSSDGHPVISMLYKGADIEPLREAAGAVANEKDAYVLCASQNGESALTVFIRGISCSQPVGSLLSSVAKAFGGKGGGRADFAQGSVKEGKLALEAAVRQLQGQ